MGILVLLGGGGGEHVHTYINEVQAWLLHQMTTIHKQLQNVSKFYAFMQHYIFSMLVVKCSPYIYILYRNCPKATPSRAPLHQSQSSRRLNLFPMLSSVQSTFTTDYLGSFRSRRDAKSRRRASRTSRPSDTLQKVFREFYLQAVGSHVTKTILFDARKD